jgi:predicted AAA+ superfamily ATPase
MELKAYQAYKNPELEISFWRTKTGLEVDFILGNMEVAIEAKAKQRVSAKDASPLRALFEEHQVNRALIVSLEREPRHLAPNITVLPWRIFVEKLWADDLVD